MQRPKFDFSDYLPDEDSFLAENEQPENAFHQQNLKATQDSSNSHLPLSNIINIKSNKIVSIILITISLLLLYLLDFNPIHAIFETQKQVPQSIQTASIHDPISISTHNKLSSLDHNQNTIKQQYHNGKSFLDKSFSNQFPKSLQQQTNAQPQQKILKQINFDTNQQIKLKKTSHQQNPDLPQQEFLQNKQTEDRQSSPQRKQVVNSENKQEEDEFELNFVQTQFEGKQTEESLAAAAFAKMESEINKLNKIEESNLEELIERKKLLEDISTLQVMIPDKSVSDYVAKDFYYFSVSIRQIILNSELQKVYSNGQKIFKISLKQHMRAIIRTQLVHNVNFKGEIQVNLSSFDKGKEEKIKAIQEIMQDEELYYESLYELSKYNMKQLRFCLVIPSYNNVKSKLYLRNLDSIFMQDYHNYHVVYVDDASPDHTGEFVSKYIEEHNIPSSKITLIINQKNRKALYNIYNAIHSHCPDGEIVGLIDGDDSLLGRKVLQLYNAIYQSRKTALLYSNFLKILTNNKTSFGFGTQITNSEFLQGKLRSDMSLVGTHFMTFYSDIFKKIVKDDLCYDNGSFYDYAYDRAIITPLIQMAYPRVEYLPEITYEYRNDTGINDGTTDWQRVSKIIMNQQPYQMIQQFSFIEKLLERNNHQMERKKQKQKSNLPKNNKELPKNYFKQDEQDEDQQD